MAKEAKVEPITQAQLEEAYQAGVQYGLNKAATAKAGATQDGALIPWGLVAKRKQGTLTHGEESELWAALYALCPANAYESAPANAIERAKAAIRPA